MESVSTSLKHFASQYPTLQSFFEEVHSLYEQRLWHPLSIRLNQFFKSAEAKPLLFDFYQRIVASFENRLSLLSVASLSILAAGTLKDTQLAITFLKNVQEKTKQDNAAFAYICSELAILYLLQDNSAEAASLIETANTAIEGVAGLDYEVTASLYRATALLAKKKSDYTGFFKACLFYLNVLPESHILHDKLEWVRDLAVSAILSDKIYNFAELIMSPHLEVLKGTPAEWYKSLVFAMNDGDMNAFEAIIQRQSNDTFIITNLPFLKQKQSLMCLVDLAFQRPTDDRVIHFSQVSAATRIHANEVEYLIMKALALDLIRGQIDELDQTVTVTWVQSRVLNLSQVAQIQAKIAHWQEKVRNVTQTISDETADSLLLAH